MAGNVVVPNIIGAVGGPDIAANLWDQNYSALAAAINNVLTYANAYQDTGSVNSLVVTIPAPTIYAQQFGTLLLVQAAFTNTSQPGIAVNGGSPVSLFFNNSAPLTPGAIVAGGVYLIFFVTPSAAWVLNPSVSATNSGVFTGALTGLTGAVPITVNWSIVGNVVQIDTGSGTGTSNQNFMALTGAPAILTPARTQQIPVYVTNNGTSGLGTVSVNNAGTLFVFLVGPAPATAPTVNGFLNSGIKGIGAGISFSYNLT